MGGAAGAGAKMGASHRGHNGRAARTIVTAKLSDSPQRACSLSDPVEATSRNRPLFDGRFLPPHRPSSDRGEHHHERERAPFRPWANGREAKHSRPSSPTQLTPALTLHAISTSKEFTQNYLPVAAGTGPGLAKTGVLNQQLRRSRCWILVMDTVSSSVSITATSSVSSIGG